MNRRNKARYLFDKQKGNCYYCKTPCVLNPPKNRNLVSNTFTIDHMRPKYYYGTDEDHNLAGACLFCNRKKAIIEQRLKVGKNIPDDLMEFCPNLLPAITEDELERLMSLLEKE